MYSTSVSKAYAQIDLESRLSGASSHELISMLFDGAINAVLRAEVYFEMGNIAKRGEMISKAINIIDNGLKSCLNHDKGLHIAHDLDRLYDYMSRTLLNVSLKNSPEGLANVSKILMDLAATWKQIEPQTRTVNNG